jgi:hypothetical protein
MTFDLTCVLTCGVHRSVDNDVGDSIHWEENDLDQLGAANPLPRINNLSRPDTAYVHTFV